MKVKDHQFLGSISLQLVSAEINHIQSLKHETVVLIDEYHCFQSIEVYIEECLY